MIAAILPQRMSLLVNGVTEVSALFVEPPDSTVCMLLAHGAGAGMEHPFMQSIAADLTQVGIATLRYQFPYMERHDKRPDAPPLCHATVRAAVAMARDLMPGAVLIAGGKSFGGRMTSQAQALVPLKDVRGLAFLGFPLHQPDKPSIDRAMHLSKIKIPMLFLQGTRDSLAELSLLRPLIGQLGALATLNVIEGADHSFHLLKRSGRTDGEAGSEMAAAISAWARSFS